MEGCLLPLPHPVVARVPVVARAADPHRRRIGRATPVARVGVSAATRVPSIVAMADRADAQRPGDPVDQSDVRAAIGVTRAAVPGVVTMPKAVRTADPVDLSAVTAVIAARAVTGATRAEVSGVVTTPTAAPTAERAMSRGGGPDPVTPVDHRGHRRDATSLARVHRVGSVATARAMREHHARRARAGRAPQAVRGHEPVDRRHAGATTFAGVRDATQRRAGRRGATKNASTEGPVEVARAVPSVRRAPSIPR